MLSTRSALYCLIARNTEWTYDLYYSVTDIRVVENHSNAWWHNEMSDGYHLRAQVNYSDKGYLFCTTIYRRKGEWAKDMRYIFTRTCQKPWDNMRKYLVYSDWWMTFTKLWNASFSALKYQRSNKYTQLYHCGTLSHTGDEQKSSIDVEMLSLPNFLIFGVKSLSGVRAEGFRHECERDNGVHRVYASAKGKQ